PKVFEAHRRIVMGARLLAVRGHVQREGLVIHLVAEQLWDWSAELDRIAEIDEAFPLEVGRGDQARSSTPDPRDQPRPPPLPGKPPMKKPTCDRSRIHLDRPTLRIASRDFH